MDQQSRDFHNQTLRNRSFAGQDLTNANFSGCDLRGCNFANTQLKGANFYQAKLGASPELIVLGIIITVVVGLITFHGVSVLVFGVLGLLWPDPLLLALAGSLLIVGCAAIALPTTLQTRLLPRLLFTAFSLALVSFFYGGIWSQNNLQVAGLMAALSACLGLFISLKYHHPRLMLGILTMGGVVSYGGLFLFGARAIHYWAGGPFWAGCLWAIGGLFHLAATLRVLSLYSVTLQAMINTSFVGANLLDTSFADSKLV